jgi:hypothetical protein
VGGPPLSIGAWPMIDGGHGFGQQTKARDPEAEEALHWPVEPGRRPRDDKAGYATIALSTLLGISANLIDKDPGQPLIWCAVLNGMPPTTTSIVMATQPKVMGPFPLPVVYARWRGSPPPCLWPWRSCSPRCTAATLCSTSIVASARVQSRGMTIGRSSAVGSSSASN